jgi:hypothetical protein
MAQQLREMAGQKAEAERRADEAAKQLADLHARTPPRWSDPALVQSPRSLDVGLTPRGYTRELRSVTQALHPLDSMYHAGDADGYARAVQLYRLAADKGNALAQYVPPTQCERARVCVCVHACVWVHACVSYALSAPSRRSEAPVRARARMHARAHDALAQVFGRLHVPIGPRRATRPRQGDLLVPQGGGARACASTEQPRSLVPWP